jgi:tRNA (mo5U34)-methyltransferase
LDWKAKGAYRAECKAKNILPQPYNLVPQVWDFEGLPGKRGFDLVHQVLQSRVEVVVDDFMKMDLKTVGEFDVVFYLGVLYHMENPLESLRRLRQVTKEVAIIETAAITIGGLEETSVCEFYPPDAKLAEDPTNFWAPNARALIGLCKNAGFSRVEILTPPSTAPKGRLVQHRLVAQAFV